MRNASRTGSLELPFLGIGISATVDRAAEILRSTELGDAVKLSSLGFLNLGLSSTTVVPPELPGMLRSAGLSSVVHFEEMNLVGSALDEERLSLLAERCRILEPEWVQEDLGVWVWDQLPLVEHMVGPIFDAASVDRAASNISRIMDVTGLPFLAENPPMYFAIGDIDLLSFMSRISERSGCDLLLDVGHFVSYCLCTGRDPQAYVAEHAADMERVVEVHLAGQSLVEMTGSPAPIWFDRHDLPLQRDALDLLERILACASRVKAITLEVEGSTDEVIRRNIEEVAARVNVEKA